jgi:hypothetical protein
MVSNRWSFIRYEDGFVMVTCGITFPISITCFFRTTSFEDVRTGLNSRVLCLSNDVSLRRTSNGKNGINKLMEYGNNYYELRLIYLYSSLTLYSFMSVLFLTN